MKLDVGQRHLAVPAVSWKGQHLWDAAAGRLAALMTRPLRNVHRLQGANGSVGLRGPSVQWLLVPSACRHSLPLSSVYRTINGRRCDGPGRNEEARQQWIPDSKHPVEDITH